jgi:1-acyl-sn-glycerol-3-phosphate acyltransferase
VLPNHQSWSDIVMMQVALNKKVPFFRFFLKQELIWVPILGIAWIALDFPFMKRHSKEQIAKNPELKAQDIETAKKACEKYRHSPVAITNFLEGTRFTKEKHDKQQSPYENLLKPKSGGIAFALSVMDGQIRKLLDVTIVYPEGNKRIWDLMSGHLKEVIIRVDECILPEDILFGDYENDPEFRQQFQNWVTNHWQQKDALINELKRAHQEKQA